MGKPIIWMFVIGALTYGMYDAGTKAERGEPEQQFRGRRAGIAMLFSGLGRSLGSAGSLALGGAAELACIGWLVMAVKNRGE